MAWNSPPTTSEQAQWASEDGPIDKCPVCDGQLKATANKPYWFDYEPGRGWTYKGHGDVGEDGGVRFFCENGCRIDPDTVAPIAVPCINVDKAENNPIPDDPATIVIVVSGGNVQDVDGVPPGVTVEIRDYDNGRECEPDDPSAAVDKFGGRYQISTYEYEGTNP